MRAMKKDYTFQKVMETQKDLKDTDGFDWLESYQNASVKLRRRYQMNFIRDGYPQQISRGFLENVASELEKIGKFFQVSIHFHPCHPW